MLVNCATPLVLGLHGDRSAATCVTVATVYGTLMNHAEALATLGDAVNRPPYKAPPKAPVLYIKPRNTFNRHGGSVVVPHGVTELEMGATLGIVIGRTACRVAEADAISVIAGYTVCNDVSVPHESYYRPSLRFKCRDGFMPIGPIIVSAQQVPHPDALGIMVSIDGRVAYRGGTSGMQRPVATLIAAVTEFMTLSPGDVLMLGVPAGAPRARAGQRVSITIDGVGALENTLVAEGAVA
jgi:5-oxopent-3-ene-1,2,5-tricarboxylate decarboxylase / 2-hydroxyhepta-2,4-diene-1,7-dioate isomerase